MPGYAQEIWGALRLIISPREYDFDLEARLASSQCPITQSRISKSVTQSLTLNIPEDALHAFQLIRRLVEMVASVASLVAELFRQPANLWNGWRGMRRNQHKIESVDETRAAVTRAWMPSVPQPNSVYERRRVEMFAQS